MKKINIGHALALYGILIAVRWAWKVNFHFTRQEKLVYVEKLREKKARQQGKETWHGVADIDDEHDFQVYIVLLKKHFLTLSIFR